MVPAQGLATTDHLAALLLVSFAALCALDKTEPAAVLAGDGGRVHFPRSVALITPPTAPQLCGKSYFLTRRRLLQLRHLAKPRQLNHLAVLADIGLGRPREGDASSI